MHIHFNRTYKMATASAPSFTPSASEPRRHQIGGIGAYKDLGAVSFSKETELNGTDKFKPASFPAYLPTWDNEKDLPNGKYVNHSIEGRLAKSNDGHLIISTQPC